MGKATIIEAQNSNTVYEEGKSKGILGKLKGIFADYKHGTRNADRLYTEELWDNRVFGSEDVMEALETKTLFGELDHPEGDRCETLAKNAAITQAGKDADTKDAALKSELETTIGTKVDKTVYDAKVTELVKADTDNLAAAKKFAQDEDKKITDVIGTASDTLSSTTVFGKIKLLQEKDAAQDQVINTKATAADLDALEALVGTKANTAADDTAFGRIAKEVARATAAEEALGGRIDTANGKITALENALDAEETGLKARMTAAETDIDSLQTDMRAAQSDIKNINTDITKIQNQLLNLVALTNDELDAMLNEVYN